VAAPPNLLYIGAFAPGPVLAVGHSYGGAVISNAATDEGETLGEPEAVADVIMTAAAAVDRPTVAARGGGK